MKPLLALTTIAVLALTTHQLAADSDRINTTIGTNRVSISISGGQRLVSANGWPDHTPGAFPRKGNPNSISSQLYHFRIPLNPKIADTTTSMRHGLVGVALNGVPFDPATAEFWNNDPASGWNYEARSGFIDLGLDQHNAHVQPTGAYHYHALPIGLVQKLGGDGNRMLLVGYAADGFPIYTANGYSDSLNSKTSVRKMHSSFRLKSGIRPSGPGGNHDGKFTEDYEYVKGSGDLDECNGRFGVTPEYPQGIYHYYITDEFPYIPRQLRGTADPSFQKARPPGGPAFSRRPPPPRSAGFIPLQRWQT